MRVMEFAWPIMRVEASMVMDWWEGGGWFLVGAEERLEPAVGVMLLVLGVRRGAEGMGWLERRVWRRARAWAAGRLGLGVGVGVVGVWGGVGWAAILALERGDESDRYLRGGFLGNDSDMI